MWPSWRLRGGILVGASQPRGAAADTRRGPARWIDGAIASRAPGRATMISDETPRTAASALLAELEREDAALEAAMRPTVEEERAVMAATQQQAAEHGDSAKAGGEHGWVGSMMRKFERFLEKHGDTYGYDAKEGLDGGSQSLVLVRAFMDYCFSGLGREQTFSGVGRKGFADEYFSLHLPYALAQKVFPMMKMVGWVYEKCRAPCLACALSRGDCPPPRPHRTSQRPR